MIMIMIVKMTATTMMGITTTMAMGLTAVSNYSEITKERLSSEQRSKYISSSSRLDSS